ncbi:hypothetical protein K8R32_00350 [bacterium]|nr:hypothetical protein [bacterium]
MNQIKPVITITDNTRVNEKTMHDPDQEIKLSVHYEPTRYDKIITFVYKKHVGKYLDSCELALNGEKAGLIDRPVQDQTLSFNLSELKTDSYGWELVCRSALHGGAEAVAKGEFIKIIPLKAREIKSIKTSNFQMALLAFYHDLGPETKIHFDKGYVTKNEFIDKEIAMYSLNYGNSDPEYYHKNFFSENGQVSVKVRSDWNPWHESGQIIELVTDKETINVHLPYVGNPTGESLFYIADDGSTYYGKADHYQYHNEYKIDINLTWEQALVPEHLAALASAAPDWSQIPQVKKNATMTNDDIDRYIKQRENLIKNQPEIEDALNVKLSSILLNEQDFESHFPGKSTAIVIDTETGVNNWLDYKDITVVDGFFQSIDGWDDS